MYLEAVTISVGYDDFLCWSIIFNKKHFDDWVIVTSTKDWNTWKLCQVYNVRCIRTSLLDNAYNKGKAINLGLSHLSRKGYVVHMDGDVILPPRMRELLELAKLDPTCIYGCDRINIVGYEKWIKHLEDPHMMYSEQIYLNLPNHKDGFTFGSRVVKTFREPTFKADLGWYPIGYFQLWNPEGSKNEKGEQIPYNENSETYAHSDMLFAANFPREKRVLLPEPIVYHLMTDDATNGINWSGRKSKRFCLEEQ